MTAQYLKRFTIALALLGAVLAVGCSKDRKDTVATSVASDTRNAFNGCLNRLRTFNRDYACGEVRTYITCSLNMYVNGQCGYTGMPQGYNGSCNSPYVCQPGAQYNNVYVDHYFNSYLPQFPLQETNDLVQRWNTVY